MNIKKGDTVTIISGKDRGKTGKVIRVFPDDSRLTVEGLNLKKKHVRPKQQGKKGQVVEIPFPLSRSAVMVVCSACKAPTRSAIAVVEGKKVRVCRKCKASR